MQRGQSAVGRGRGGEPEVFRYHLTSIFIVQMRKRVQKHSKTHVNSYCPCASECTQMSFLSQNTWSQMYVISQVHLFPHFVFSA